MVAGGLVYFAGIVAIAPRIPYPLLHDAALTPAFVAIIYGLALRPSWSRVLDVKPPYCWEKGVTFVLSHRIPTLLGRGSSSPQASRCILPLEECF